MAYGKLKQLNVMTNGRYLIALNLPILHDFAYLKLGMFPSEFRINAFLPHYRLTKQQLRKAIDAGAVFIRDEKEFLWWWYAMFGHRGLRKMYAVYNMRLAVYMEAKGLIRLYGIKGGVNIKDGFGRPIFTYTKRVQKYLSCKAN